MRLARDWVTGVLTDIGRGELADSARLAVSELVTNAILHAEPPMTVHVRGTVDRPRIEVTDQSMVPPRQRHSRAEIDLDDEFSWSTVGRGLDLVASYARRWGADIDPRGLGKVVWFEPSAEARDEPAEGELFNMDDVLARRAPVHSAPQEMIRLQLCAMPVELFAHLRLHFNELGRELRLISLSEPEQFPIAVEFAEAYLQVEHERRQAEGPEHLDAAIEAGAETVDLDYRIPATAPTTMARVAELLDVIYRDLAEDTLLAVRPGPDLLALQRWYLGEFVRQGDGLDPVPWSGPTRLSARQEVS